MVIGIDCSRAFVEEKTGTENYSYQLIKHMLRVPKASQHKFVLFTRPKAIMPDWVWQKNVEIQPIKLRYLWTQVGLALMTWQKGLDVLWVPAHTLPILRRPGLRTVVTIHGLEYQWLPEYTNWLQRWYLPLSTFYAGHRATKLIAVSQFTAEQLKKDLHISSKKITVIYEGVEIDARFQNTEVNKALGRYGLQRKKYVLFVGTIQPRKNLVSLIRAFAQLGGTHPDYRLVIAGAVGWMAEPVLHAARDLGIAEKVVFTGRVDDLVLSLLYQGAMVYAQPSLTEGFGLPALEAMAYGVPVVVSSGGALPEVVAESGVIVPLGMGFEGRLTQALKRVVADKHLYARLVGLGTKRVKQLNWVKAAEETLEVLIIH